MTSLREIYQDWQEEENKITFARINNKEELLQKIKLYLPEYFHAEWDQERKNIRIINGDGLFDVFPCHILPCIDRLLSGIDRWQNNPYMVKFDEFCEKYRTLLKLDILEILFFPEEILSAIQKVLLERYEVSLHQSPHDGCYASLKPNEVPWSLNFMDNWRGVQVLSKTFTRHEYNFYEARRIKAWALNEIAEYEKKHKLSYSKEQLLEML